MESTKNIQQLLFRTIDGLRRKDLRKTDAVRELLVQTALGQVPFLYGAVCQHIEMLLAEYCPPSRKNDG